MSVNCAVFRAAFNVAAVSRHDIEMSSNRQLPNCGHSNYPSSISRIKRRAFVLTGPVRATHSAHSWPVIRVTSAFNESPNTRLC